MSENSPKKEKVRSDSVLFLKSVAKELGLTQKEFSSVIGYNTGALHNSISLNKVSAPLLRAAELALENHRLKRENELLKSILSQK